MKALNFIDLVVQTLILSLVVIPIVPMLFARNLEDILTAAMYGALFLGPWQFVSSLITTLSKGLYLKLRVIHLLSSIGYFVVFGVGIYFFQDMDVDGILGIIGGVLAFGIPAALATLYYYVTVKSFQLASAAAKSASVNAASPG